MEVNTAGSLSPMLKSVYPKQGAGTVKSGERKKRFSKIRKQLKRKK